MSKKLNLACGLSKFPGFVNVDIDKSTEPDIVWDIKSKPPFEDNCFDIVWFIHGIEHIEFKFWDNVIENISKIMKDGGQLVLAYPEFEQCVRHFIDNSKGHRDFWRMTLYGRQLSIGDYHFSPVMTSELVPKLKDYGFHSFDIYSENVPNEFNTVVKCRKGDLITYEDVLRKEIFQT